MSFFSKLGSAIEAPFKAIGDDVSTAVSDISHGNVLGALSSAVKAPMEIGMAPITMAESAIAPKAPAGAPVSSGSPKTLASGAQSVLSPTASVPNTTVGVGTQPPQSAGSISPIMIVGGLAVAYLIAKEI